MSPAAHRAVNSNNRKENVSFSFPSYFEPYSGKETPLRGELLGIVRPVWRKVVESECRLAWLNEMVRENLIVRDIQSYAKSVSASLRSEEMIMKEEERKVLSELMKVKLKDERKHLETVKRIKELARNWIKRIIGKYRKYESIMKCLKGDIKVWRQKENLLLHSGSAHSLSSDTLAPQWCKLSKTITNI